MEMMPFGHDLVAFGGEKKKGGDFLPGERNTKARLEKKDS